MFNSEDALVRAALAEDVGPGDVTSDAIVSPEARCGVIVVAKQAGVLSGMCLFHATMQAAGAEISRWHAEGEGDSVEFGAVVASFEGNTRAVLRGERSALNFLQRLSGIASLTARYVAAVEGLTCGICDTRKTTPLLRQWEKAAVLHGGGRNHRQGLHDGILIKENHIAAAGGIREAVSRTRAVAHHLLRIEVEVQSLDDIEAALAVGVDAILLDNMDLEAMRKAVERVRGAGVILEASGNVSLNRVRDIAETGVDLISVGALTHSAPALDLSLLIEHG